MSRAKTITTAKGVYLIRGNWTEAELKQQYQTFLVKFRSQISFETWLIERGKVYVRLRKG